MTQEELEEDRDLTDAELAERDVIQVCVTFLTLPIFLEQFFKFYCFFMIKNLARSMLQ